MSDVIQTTNPYEDEAREILGQFRALVQRIKGYGFTTLTHRRRLTPSAIVPLPYLLSCSVALDASEELTRMARITAAEIRDIVSYENAFAPVAHEFRLAASGVDDTILVRKADVGKRTLGVYRIARSLNSPTDQQVLIPHIAEMKRTLDRGRKRVLPATGPVPGDPGVAKKA